MNFSLCLSTVLYHAFLVKNNTNQEDKIRSFKEYPGTFLMFHHAFHQGQKWTIHQWPGNAEFPIIIFSTCGYSYRPAYVFMEKTRTMWIIEYKSYYFTLGNTSFQQWV